MDAVEDSPCHVFHLLLCGRDDARNEVVNVDFKDVPKGGVVAAFSHFCFCCPCPVGKLVLW